MIADFETLCTWMYVIVDEIWQQVAPRFARPGPAPQCSDSELLTLFLVSECLGWDVETEAVRHWHAQRDVFPQLPSQRRAHRRRRSLQPRLQSGSTRRAAAAGCCPGPSVCD